MATTEEIKAAERRGYSKGYSAGLRRKDREQAADEARRQKNAFYNQALLVSLPVCIEVSNWKQGDKAISDIPGRTKLARDFAIEATKYWRDDT